jgi:hypothetical protein
MAQRAQEKRNLIEDLILETLVLDECHVVRGDAEDASPGGVKSEIDVAFSKEDNVVFTVKSSHHFMNVDGALLATVDANFIASYTYNGPDPSDEEVQQYAETALMLQVVPFIREFLATMTNRLALTPYYLPLFAKRGVLAQTESGAGR